MLNVRIAWVTWGCNALNHLWFSWLVSWPAAETASGISGITCRKAAGVAWESYGMRLIARKWSISVPSLNPFIVRGYWGCINRIGPLSVPMTQGISTLILTQNSNTSWMKVPDNLQCRLSIKVPMCMLNVTNCSPVSLSHCTLRRPLPQCGENRAPFDMVNWISHLVQQCFKTS